MNATYSAGRAATWLACQVIHSCGKGRNTVPNHALARRSHAAQRRQLQHRARYDHYEFHVSQGQPVETFIKPQGGERAAICPAMQCRNHGCSPPTRPRSQQDVRLITVRVQYVGTRRTDLLQQVPQHRRGRSSCDADREDLQPPRASRPLKRGLRAFAAELCLRYMAHGPAASARALDTIGFAPRHRRRHYRLSEESALAHCLKTSNA